MDPIIIKFNYRQNVSIQSAPGVSHLGYLSKMLTPDRTTVDSLSVFEITSVPCNGEPFTVAILGLNGSHNDSDYTKH